MDHAKKLEFVHRMTKLALGSIPHFDTGGAVNTQGGGLITPVSDALGLSDKFQAGSAAINAGTNQDQLNSAYQGAQTGLTNQNNLTNTLQPQAGQGVNEQNQLASQFTAEANGTGPNVAQNQLNQATAANTANQAALMAGQRGSSQNAGLIARQAAQTGASNQQAAAGQAATLGAQQQIAAQQNLASLAGNQISQAGQAITNQNSAQQGEQGTLQNANTAANNAAVNMQSNINNTNAATAAANQNENNSLFGSLAKGASAIGSLFAEGGEVDTPLNPQTPVTLPSSSAGSSSSPDLSSLAPLAMMAMASGGQIAGNPLAGAHSAASPSFVANWLTGNNVSTGSLSGPGEASMPKFQGIDQSQIPGPKQKDPYSDITGSAGELPGAGEVDEDSPPEGTTSTTMDMDPNAMRAAKGGMAKRKLAAAGGKVNANSKAQKAKVKGDSYSNDTIPALLSEGEIVIDRDTLASRGPEGKAARFLRAHYAKKGLAKK